MLIIEGFKVMENEELMTCEGGCTGPGWGPDFTERRLMWEEFLLLIMQ